ncbi:MAG: acyltransferase [Rubrivivax sp.]|nr:acyltransferase [Rubrivivax sp.]
MAKANPTGARGFLRAGRRRVACAGQRVRAAVPAPAPAQNSEHRLDVQGLRAVAVLLVLAFHGGLGVHGGFVGVDVFFVISGFVITAMLQREWLASGRIDFARFYLRRFRRLVPALALVVTATLLASAVVLSPEGTQQIAAKTGIGAMLIGANAVIAHVTGGYFDPPAHANPLLNTWSLSVEEQFYVVFPALLALSWAWRARAGPARSTRAFAPLVMTAFVAAASFALAAAAAAQALPEAGAWWSGLIGFYSPLTRAWEFAAGSAVALLLAWRGPNASGAARASASAPRGAAGTLAGALGALGLVASVALITPATPFPGAWTLLPVASTVLLIVAGSGNGGNAVSRGLSARPLTAIGDWSYSLYLWHWPLVALAQELWPGSASASAAALLLSFPIAIASYRGVEQPLRLAARSRTDGGRVRTPKRSWRALAAATIAAPVALAATLHVAAEAWFGNAALRAERAALAMRPTGLDDGRGCSQRAPVAAKDLAACRWNAGAAGAPVYLVGDSNAQQFSDALIAAGRARQRPVVTLTTAGCPFVDAWLRRDAEPAFGAECRAAFESALAWLKAQSPGTVLVASVDRYWRDADYRISASGRFDGASSTASQAARDNAAAMNEGLARAVRSLQDAGHEVTLIQTIPQFVSHEHPMQHGQCRGWEVLLHACARPFGSMPRSDADAWQSAARQGLAAVAGRTGATLADLRGFFCAGGMCSTRSASGVDLYMPDGYHLNRAGSARLAGEFTALLDPAAGGTAHGGRVALQRVQ